MKKKIITGSMIVAIAIISFYLGTTVNSLFASPSPDKGSENKNAFAAVAMNGKIYAVWAYERSYYEGGGIVYKYQEAKEEKEPK